MDRKLSKTDPRPIKPGEEGKSSLCEMGLTLVHPFFGEEERFEKLFNNWLKYSTLIKDKLKIILVDDYGNPPINSLLTKNKLKYLDFNLSIFRIEENLKYNTPGALNLGVMCADSEWVLIMDSDCTFFPDEMEKIMNFRPNNKFTYKFPRKRITNDSHKATNTRFLPCTILFHKNLFLNINGFDEDFTGEWSNGYGFFDNHFDIKVIANGFGCRLISNIIATEWMPDFVGPHVVRNEEHHNINKRILYDKRNNRMALSNHMLRFPWKLEFHHDRKS